MNISKYETKTAFFDVLFNSLLAFAAMFMVAFLMISPEEDKSKAQIISKAEFIITMTWPPDQNDDIDIYVEDPLGNLTYFGARESGFLHQDRDDLGGINDTISTIDGVITYNENKETVTVRQIIAGEYTVNVHFYAHRSSKDVEVTLQLDKLNPFSTITIKKVMLYQNGDERTAFRFVLDKDGKVLSVNTLAKPLAEKVKHANMVIN